MKIAAGFGVIVLALLTGCAPRFEPTSADDLGVLRVVAFSNCTPNCEFELVDHAPIVDLASKDLDRPEWDLTSSESSAVDHLLRRNANQHPLPQGLTSHPGVSPRQSQPALEERDPIDTAVLVLSLPGFDKKGSAAVVLMKYSCGTECGYTRLVVLAKVGDTWRVDRTLELLVI